MVSKIEKDSWLLIFDKYEKIVIKRPIIKWKKKKRKISKKFFQQFVRVDLYTKFL